MKKLRFLAAAALCFFVAAQAYAQRPKVAVVLSGGGAKGAAHVGVLKVLEEYDIPVDIITGTSMGALVGGLYAVGHSAAELDSIIVSQDWEYVITGTSKRESLSYEQKTAEAKYLVQVPFGFDWNNALRRKSPIAVETADGVAEEQEAGDGLHLAPEGSSNGLLPMGLMGGQKIYSLLSECTVGYHEESDFSKFPIPYACVAVDIVTGKEIVFNKGILPIALRASMAIPGVFPPVKTGGMVLVDGGLRNNYPVDVARAMGADIVIGVKTPSDGSKIDYNNVADMLSKVVTVAMTAKTSNALEDTDILIQPDIENYGTMSFDNKSLRHLIDNGEKAAREAVPQLLELKKWLAQKEKENAESFVGPQPAAREAFKATKVSDTIVLSSIRFVGVGEKEEALLRKKFHIDTCRGISISDIESAVDGIYGTNAYNSVVYSLEGNQSPFDLVMTLVPNRNNRLGLGLRFDTEEISSILVDLGLNTNSLYGSRFGLSGRLANYYQFQAEYSYVGANFAGFEASYRMRHSALPLYSQDKSKYHLIDYLQNNVDLSLTSGNLRKLKVEAGLDARLYYYRTALDNPNVPEIYSTDDGRTAFFGPFVKLGVDTQDNAWFPTKGTRVDLNAVYLTDISDIVNLGGDATAPSPLLAASLSAKYVGSIGGRFAFTPFVHSRIIIGDEIPAAMMNCIGGCQAGRYTEQQIPFYGSTGVIACEPFVAVAGLDLRYEIFGSHYLMLTGNYARSGGNLQGFAHDSGITGLRAGYAYDLVTGPLEVDINWNSHYPGLGFYASLGFWF